MNSLVSYESNDTNCMIIISIIIVLSFIGVIHFVSIKFDTIKKANELDSTLMIKQIKELNERYDSLSLNTINVTLNRFKHKLTLLEYDISSLKTSIHNNNTKLNEDMLLWKQDNNLYTDFTCVSVNSELTEKINELEIKIDDVIIRNKMQRLEDRIIKLEEVPSERIDTKVEIVSKLEYILGTTQSYNERHETEIAYLKQNYKGMMDNMEIFCERLYDLKKDYDEKIGALKSSDEEQVCLIKSYNKDALYKTELLNDKVIALTSGYDNTFKEIVHNMDSLYQSHIILRSEFEEKCDFVYCGIGEKWKTSIINTYVYDFGQLGQEVCQHGFNVNSLKYLKNIKNIELKILYFWSKTLYVKSLTDILDTTEVSQGQLEHPLFIKRDGTRKVIEYIRSIRPDIELTWNGTPL